MNFWVFNYEFTKKMSVWLKLKTFRLMYHHSFIVILYCPPTPRGGASESKFPFWGGSTVRLGGNYFTKL